MVDTELKQKWILAQQAFSIYHLWMSSRDYVLHATDCVTVSVPLQHLMLSCAWNVIMARYRRNFLSEWTDMWLLSCHIIVTSALLVLRDDDDQSLSDVTISPYLCDMTKRCCGEIAKQKIART